MKADLRLPALAVMLLLAQPGLAAAEQDIDHLADFAVAAETGSILPFRAFSVRFSV